MPQVSRFLGIVTTMYANDEEPPHFHVRYDDHRATVGIKRLELIGGRLPSRVLGLVMEWAESHQLELLANWRLLSNEGIVKKIAPLV